MKYFYQLPRIIFLDDLLSFINILLD